MPTQIAFNSDQPATYVLEDFDEVVTRLNHAGRDGGLAQFTENIGQNEQIAVNPNVVRTVSPA